MRNNFAGMLSYLVESRVFNIFIFWRYQRGPQDEIQKIRLYRRRNLESYYTQVNQYKMQDLRNSH